MSAPALLAAIDATDKVYLVIGSDPLANARCNKILEVGGVAIIVAPQHSGLHHNLQSRLDQGEIRWVEEEFHDRHLTTLGRQDVDNIVDGVFVTSTTSRLDGIPIPPEHIFQRCCRKRIPINVADRPDLSTFTILTTHTSGPVQIGVTTSGRGCKLAARIKREIVASLPPGLGQGVEQLGRVRADLRLEDETANGSTTKAIYDDETGQDAHFNDLIKESDVETAKSRRIRWLSQICEYWPLSRLAAITQDDVDAIMQSYSLQTPSVLKDSATAWLDHGAVSLMPRKPARKGRIVLAGSGPGHPDLLTNLTLKAIRNADLILADKLVPAAVLDLIPRRTPVRIARKFPGNAEAAQEELLNKGLEAIRQGQMVLRLKQGDPYLYGRGAEEYAFFRAHGYKVTVIPGITSALSAPLCADIPVTHRAVSDQVLICTGTGRKGASPDPPLYQKNQTVVFLMALHRVCDLVDSLVLTRKWPQSTPCAVIERASCADQRVIRTSLEHVCAAIEEVGSRPPGLLVVGSVCAVLRPGAQQWTVEEGFDGFDGLVDEKLEELTADADIRESLTTLDAGDQAAD